MKKIALYALLCGSLSFTSCDMFEIDNYEEPKETLIGEVVDVATGERVQTDQGGEGIRVRLTETSWGSNVTPNPDFFCKQDGTFQNTKLFKGTYNIRIDGPFIPLIRESAEGVPIANETKDMEISGVTKVTFKVQPFLKVEWVGLPVVINNKISAKVKVTRAVSDNDFRDKIKPTIGDKYSDGLMNVTDVQLFVSYSSSVGYRARDDRWSSKIEYSGADFSPNLGIPIEILSKGTIPSGRTIFVRAAARINYATLEQRRFNYSEPLEIRVP